MIRSKKEVSLNSRLQNEILNSLIFKNLFQNRPELVRVAKEKIIPISGDLVLERLGISEDDRITLIEELDIIISAAASVSFNEPLKDALKINYFGASRMLELASECKHLQVLSHVSTAYVGSNLPPNSLIYERI